MGSIDEIQQVCRLCLDKDEVNIPIFDESSDARQTFLKISACLPVKVSRDDNLPKNICDGCSCKLDMLYVFRNTSVDSEKQLIQWLNQAGLSVPPSTAVRDGAAKPEILVKQEAFDSSEMSEAQNYLIQQQKLTYSEEFAFGEVTEDSPGDLLPENEEPSPKRARRSTAKRQPVLDDTDDDEMDSMHITKAEADEDDSDDGDQADYGDTASADDQPGPSGVNRSGADAPLMINALKLPKSLKIRRVVKKSEGSESMALRSKSPSPSITSDHDYASIHQASSPKTSQDQVEIIFSDSKESSSKRSRDHVKDMFSKATYFCTKCNGTFPTFAALDNHAMTVNCVPVEHKCDHCNKIFKTRSSLTNHIRSINTGRMAYVCDTCGKIVYNAISMRVHLEQFHNEHFERLPNSTNSFKCRYCGILREKRSAMWAHVNGDHLNKFTCKCEICGKGFPHESILKRHVTTHNPDIFECEFCGKEFTYKAGLIKHKASHKNVEYACDECPKVFKSRQRYNEHKRMHSGDVAFECHICDKKFVARHMYIAHIKVHHKDPLEMDL